MSFCLTTFLINLTTYYLLLTTYYLLLTTYYLLPNNIQKKDSQLRVPIVFLISFYANCQQIT